MQYAISNEIIAGMFAGTAQWLILRKYVSEWKWILVVGLSVVSIHSTRIAVNIQIESLLSFANGKGFVEQGVTQIVLVVVVSSIFAIGLIFISGYLQWYVLRPYAVNARWWIFIPLIAMLAGIAVLPLEFL